MNIDINAKLQYFKIGKYGGIHAKTDDYSNTPRPYFSIGMILRGNGKFYTENSDVVNVSPGEIIIVPSAATYISHWHGTPNISFIIFHFIFDKDFEGNIPIQKISSFEHLKKDFEFAYENFSVPAHAFKVLSIFYNMLSEIFPSIKIISEKHINSSIKKAVDYITYNYTNNINIAELSKIANLSPSRFFTVFKKETGVSPIEYKNRISIRNAEKMLVSEDYSIEEISEKIGFNSASYFRRTFKAFTGKSPREYKNAFRENPKL